MSAGIAVFAPLAWAGTEHPDVHERREPQPWPQVDIPSRSDYTEARKLLDKQKWEEAAIVLRSILKRNPDFFPGAIELARAMLYLGRREEALMILSQSGARQTGARKAALIARTGVISRTFLTQKTFQVYQDGLNLLTQQKYRPARERFERALETEPDNVEILTRIGECLVLEGDFDSAAERLRLAKRLNPYEPEISLWLGRALHQRGELSQAVEELRIARQGLPGSERAPVWYAQALLSSGNRKAAVQDLENDLDSKPFHLVTAIMLARLRMELFKDGSDSLWTARKELQVALSRMSEYEASLASRSESELGVDLKQPAATLKAEITGLLAQLDVRLKDSSPRGASRQKR